MSAELKKLLSRPELADAVKHSSPPDADQLIAVVQKFFPQILQCTEAQAQEFKAGHWNESATRDMVRKQIEVFQDFKFKMSPVSEKLIDLFRKDSLRGAELELASRIFGVHLEELKLAVNGKRSPGTKPALLPI